MRLLNIVEKGVFFSFLFCIALFQKWTLDSDGWFILNSGRLIEESGLPYSEPFTMHKGLDFVLEQWLTDILYWNVFSIFGKEALLTLVFLIGCLIIFLYYRIGMLITNQNKPASFLLSVCTSLLFVPYFIVIRPQILSSLLLLLEIYCLESYIQSKKRLYLFLLPVIALLLVNLHSALFPMCFILLLPYIVEGILSHVNSSLFQKTFSLSLLLKTSVLMFFVGFLNPYGWDAMSFVFVSYDPEIHQNIMECAPSTLDKSYFLFFYICLSIVSCSLVRMPVRYIFLSLGTAIMALMAIRSQFLFALFGTYPILYALKNWVPFNLYQEVMDEGKKVSFGKKALIILLNLVFLCACIYLLSMDGLERFPVVALLVICLSISFSILYILFFKKHTKRFFHINLKYILLPILCVIFLFFAKYYDKQMEDSTEEEYKEAIDFLMEEKKNNQKEIVLWTGMNSGAYAEYRGFEAYFDARPEVFAPSNHHQGEERNIAKEYFDTRNDLIDYDSIFKKYHITHILVTPGDIAPYISLPHDSRYRMIYEGKDKNGEVNCRIFVPIQPL